MGAPNPSLRLGRQGDEPELGAPVDFLKILPAFVIIADLVDDVVVLP